MRKILTWLAVGLLLVTPVFAKSEKITVEGKTVTLDVQEKNGRKLYPLRGLCNEMGIEILEVKGNYADLLQDDNEVVYHVGSGLINNATGYFKSDVGTMRINNTIYVPIRSMAYMFGYDIQNAGGLSLSKKADFQPPKATEASLRLGNDLYVIACINDLFQEDAYIKSLAAMLETKDAAKAGECRKEILEMKAAAQELSASLTTQTAKAVYTEYISLLEVYADLFAHVQTLNTKAMTKDMEKIDTIETQLEEKLQTYIQVLRKNATLIQ